MYIPSACPRNNASHFQPTSHECTSRGISSSPAAILTYTVKAIHLVTLDQLVPTSNKVPNHVREKVPTQPTVISLMESVNKQLRLHDGQRSATFSVGLPLRYVAAPLMHGCTSACSQRIHPGNELE